MASREPVRWGILSTANISTAAFLPALHAAGGGIVRRIGGRDLDRARDFAAEYGIEHASVGYESVIADDEVDAVYIPLPNSLHADWTIAAIRAGKAILCEKPLTATLPEAERVTGVAQASAALLWEAFVFPFAEQTERMLEITGSGEIGELEEIQASWHFRLRSRENIRLSAELGGGSLRDVGCYCLRLARLLFHGDAEGGTATALWAPEEVDEEMQGILSFPGNRRLLFSCGMRRWGDTLTRVIGSEGELRLTNAYHPRPSDTMVVRRPDGAELDRSTPNAEPSFTPAIRHIHRVLWGEERARNLAVEDALGNAVAIDLLERSARSGHYEQL